MKGQRGPAYCLTGAGPQSLTLRSRGRMVPLTEAAEARTAAQANNRRRIHARTPQPSNQQLVRHMREWADFMPMIRVIPPLGVTDQGRTRWQISLEVLSNSSSVRALALFSPLLRTCGHWSKWDTWQTLYTDTPAMISYDKLSGTHSFQMIGVWQKRVTEGYD